MNEFVSMIGDFVVIVFITFLGPSAKRKRLYNKRGKNGRFQLKKGTCVKVSEQDTVALEAKIKSPNKRMSFSFEDSRECSVERTASPRKQESVNSVSSSSIPRSSPRLRRMCQNMPNSEIACSDITNTEPPPSIKTEHVGTIRQSPRIRSVKSERDDSCPNLSPQGQDCDISDNSLSQPPHLSELHVTTVPSLTSSPRLRRTSVTGSDTCHSPQYYSDASGSIKTENVDCSQDSEILGQKCEVDGRNIFESLFAGLKSSSSASVQSSPRTRNLSCLNGVRQSPRLQERCTLSRSNSLGDSAKSTAVKCLDKHFLNDCQKDDCEIDVVGIDQDTEFNFSEPISGFEKLMWGSILKPRSKVSSSQEKCQQWAEPNNNCHMYRSLSDQCLTKKQQREHHKKRKLSYSVTSSFEDSDETSPVKKVPKLIIRKNKGQEEDILLLEIESKVKRNGKELFNNVSPVKPYPKKLRLKLGNDLTEINLPQ